MAKRNNQQQHFHSHQNTSSRVMPKLEKCLADNDVHVLLSENKKLFSEISKCTKFSHISPCAYMGADTVLLLCRISSKHGTSALSDKQRTRYFCFVG